MLIWCLVTYAMLMVGVAGELTGSDLWSLVVEAEKDAPHRRITPKHLFATPNHKNRTEQCQQGYKFNHLGKCVPVVKPDKVDLQSELANWRRRAQVRKPMPPLTELPASSTGPYHISLPLGPKITTMRPYPTTVSSSPVIDYLRETTTSSLVPQPYIPILTTKPDASTVYITTTSPRTSESETTSVTFSTTKKESGTNSTEKAPMGTISNETERTKTSSSEKVPTINISTDIEPNRTISSFVTTEKQSELVSSTTESPKLVIGPLSNITESSRRTKIEEVKENMSLLPLITEENLIETSTMPEIEGSGTEEEGSGFEGSGVSTSLPEEVEDTTVRYEDNRPLRSTTLNDEITTELFTEESTLPTPSATKPSMLLSILKGVSKDITEKGSVETTTQYPVTTSADPEPTDWLPIVEYVGLDFPKTNEKMEQLPVENIGWKYSDEKNNERLEIPKHDTVPTRPGVVFFEFKKDETPKGSRISNEKVEEEFIGEIPSSWVRFPDNFENPSRGDYLSRGEEFSTSRNVFRFPEEIVLPEHRPTLLKFWSKIPMYQSEFKKELSSVEDF